MNNFNYLSARKPSIFFHDIVGEYAIVKKHFSLGGGLTGWAASSRFAAPAVISIIGLDAPIFEQSTNDATDQFLRKFAVYAKGQISKFEYRIAVAKPFAIQQSTLYNPAKPISAESQFSIKDPQLQYSGYFIRQFFDHECNQIPYMAGTYLGQKKVTNIGLGFEFQRNTMWH